MTTMVTEALGAAERVGPGRFKYKIITPGKGTSGNYTAEVLQEAATNKVFPRGTLSMVNHLTKRQRAEQPAGDLRNLAGVLNEDAYWDGEALVAEVKIGSAWRGFVEEFFEHIGVSIAAEAVFDNEGNVVKLIPSPLNSVDLVTAAGRGGEITEVMEAAHAIESRSIVQEATAEETRMLLEVGLREKFDEKIDEDLYVIDHDDQYVYYNHEQKTFRHAYQINENTVELNGEPQEVVRQVSYTPLDQTQPANDPEPDPKPIQENIMAEIDDQELTELREKAARVDELEATLDELRSIIAQEKAEERKASAMNIVTESFGDTPPKLYTSMAETVAASEQYDPEVFKSQVQEAAGFLATPAGDPNLGHTGNVTEQKTYSPDDMIAALEGKN